MRICVYVCKAWFRIVYDVKNAETVRTHKHPYAHTFAQLFILSQIQMCKIGVCFRARGVAPQRLVLSASRRE